MPSYDGTGPGGKGAMTGGGRGYCAVQVKKDAGDMPAGRFLRRGAGRGWRNWYYATGLPGWRRAAGGDSAYSRGISAPAVNEEKEMLKNEAEALKNELEDIQNRIQTLEKVREEK